jgi:hypothetical protein
LSGTFSGSNLKISILFLQVIALGFFSKIIERETLIFECFLFRNKKSRFRRIGFKILVKGAFKIKAATLHGIHLHLRLQHRLDIQPFHNRQ